MSHPRYFVELDKLLGKKLKDLSHALNALETKSAGSVQLGELCSMVDYPHGVYIFSNFSNKHKVPWYVGTCVSRSFIERIAAHFRQNPSWFTTLTKKIIKNDNCSYDVALKTALSLHLIMIGVKEKSVARKFENVLRSYLQPMLNKTKQRYTGDEILRDILDL